VAFFIANGLRASIDAPSPDEMRDFLYAIDTTDEERPHHFESVKQRPRSFND